MSLTPKQTRFGQEYLIDLNATQAAIRAGYSPKTAKQTGSRLLTNADVSEFIESLKSKQADTAEVSAEWVLDRLRDIAENGTVESARVRALELLGKYRRLWVERVEQTNNDSNVVIVIPDNGRDPELTAALEAG